MLIRNYGLFWKLDLVFWGKQKTPGRLLGKTAGKKGIIDFRDQIGIYALYADYDLIYVGQTGAQANQKLFHRLRHHRKHLSGRWNRFSWFGTRWITNNGSLSAENAAAHPPIQIALNHLEAIIIEVAEPPLNRQGGKWAGAEEYVQVRDAEYLGPTEAEYLRSIHKQLSAFSQKQ